MQRIRRLLVTLIGLGMSSVTLAQEAPKWIRYPAISPDGRAIAFTYKGNIYTVPADGGEAKQLTFHEAHDYRAVWSPDGKQLAFASDRYGNFDVFLMSAQGGSASRLTFHSSDEVPYDFSADGTQVFFGAQRMDLASHRQYPTRSQPELYQVSVSGGRVDQVWTIPAEDVQGNATGTKWIYHDKKGGENEWRKHHQSSIARDIWLYDSEEGSHQKLTEFYGEDRNPVFSPDEEEIYYLSESEGSFNVFALPLSNPDQSRALTDFEKFPVRFLSISQQGLMSFSYDGELYTLRDGESPAKVPVQLSTQDIANSDQFITINGGVREMSISPDGKELAFIARGEVFVTAVDGSLTKRITETPEQERFVEFAPDGKSLYYSSEREGRWQLMKAEKVREEETYFFASTLIEEKPVLDWEGESYLPKISPNGKKIAYVADRRSVVVRDLATGATVTLLSPEDLLHMSDGDQYFTWSPDSQWLLATYSPTMVNGEVVLLDASGKLPFRNLTKSGYDDGNAMWVNEGKQMLWLSNRDGMRSYATSGQSERDVYTLFFDQEAWDRFNLSEDEYKLVKDLEKKKEEKPKGASDEKEKDSKKVEPLIFDWEGIENRKAKLTIHSSRLAGAVLSKDGEKLYYLARFEKGYNLWSTDLRTKETKQEIKLDATSGSLAWDKTQKNLFLLSDGAVSKIDPKTMKREQIKIKGEMTYDREAEWKHLFDHVWLRTKGIFYTPDMHGVNWEEAREDYRRYLPHIGNNYEFAEILSELLGELNVSHAGARYTRSIPLPDQTAALGIFWDYTFEGDGIKITEILPGGPLDKAAFAVQAGMVIQKIDGKSITPDRDFAQLLNRKEGQWMLLEIADAEGENSKQITIQPISLQAENALLYKRWVKKNQEEVTKKSGGRLGYVHIPGMSDGPYRTIYEEMMGKYHDTEGVIVDTRFNGGGDLVADLAMFFTGEQFLTYATAQKEVGYEPTARWTKPTLALFNEANYSDGHCFACGYTDLQIGKTVGMPTPGTCSFAGWERLPNGVVWGAVPVSAKNKAGEWLENNETRPDFEIKNMPGKIDQGIDQQLEKAIEELIKELD